jgi:hypothetical protein
VDRGDILANVGRFAEKHGRLVVRAVTHKKMSVSATYPSTSVGTFLAEERRPLTLAVVDMLYDEKCFFFRDRARCDYVGCGM